MDSMTNLFWSTVALCGRNFFGRSSEVSHDYGWRGFCAAGTVTAVVVGCTDWLAGFFSEIFTKIIRMASLMHEPENIQRLILDLIIEQVRKRTATAAGKSMRPDVIPALPLNHHSYRVLHSCMKVVTKPRRNRGVARFFFEQPLLEE
jgi:hypothetical protein